MNEYRIKGLSCGNCARELEQEIKRLEYGADATLSYNSGKLKVDPRISLPHVERILKADGAYIVYPDRDAEAALLPPDSVSSPLSRAHGHDERLHGHRDHTHHDHRYEAAAAHSHAHDHSQGQGESRPHAHSPGGSLTLRLLAVSGILYLAALLFQSSFSEPVLILLYIVAAALSGYTTFIRGAKNLFRLRFNIDTLMTIALVGAFSIGEWKEAAFVAILFGLNELLEGYGMERARLSMEALLRVAPRTAVRLDGEQERTVPVEALQSGDFVLVKPGEKIPSDGIVAKGLSSVNEAAVTGEPLPVDKKAGDAVFGGSLNNEGALQIRISKAYQDSSLARILALVQEAQDTKTPTELFINKFARYYTPFIMIVAALVMLIPPLLLQGEWHRWLYQGLSVLIVGCPCALILSSPIAIVAGITRNARNGILVKGGVHLEQLGKIDILAFDKTGTLTKGEPHVVLTDIYEEERFYRIAGAVESASSHPLAKAVMKEIERLQIDYPKAEQVTNLPGSGIAAIVQGNRYWVGNEASMAQLNLTYTNACLSCIEEWKRQGLSLVLVADESQVLGMFGIADAVREESRDVIAALGRSGIRRTVMLTGDHKGTAAIVAEKVGVSEYYGGLLPEDKVRKIKELAGSGKVAMVGDGVNDAPALAAASLGIAMGKGTDSAIETADIVLMQDHLGKLPEAVALSKRVNRMIRFNIGVALGLKLAALLLTIPGWLTLWFAIISDMGATVFVTLASLTLLIDWRSGKKRSETAGEPERLKMT